MKNIIFCHMDSPQPNGGCFVFGFLVLSLLLHNCVSIPSTGLQVNLCVWILIAGQWELGGGRDMFSLFYDI